MGTCPQNRALLGRTQHPRPCVAPVCLPEDTCPPAPFSSNLSSLAVDTQAATPDRSDAVPSRSDPCGATQGDCWADQLMPGALLLGITCAEVIKVPLGTSWT